MCCLMVGTHFGNALLGDFITMGTSWSGLAQTHGTDPFSMWLLDAFRRYYGPEIREVAVDVTWNTVSS